MQVAIEFLFRADGVGNDECRVQIQTLTRSHDVGDFSRLMDLPAHRVPGVREIETGEPLGAVSHQADVERLQSFEGRADVQDRLDA